MTNAVAAIQSLRDDLHQKLLQNPDYRAMIALDRAIMEASGQPMSPLQMAVNHLSALPGSLVASDAAEAARHSYLWGVAANALPFTKMSQADAAYAVLQSTMQPMTTAELIDPVRKMGATLGGDDPATNLSSSLSREKDRFQSLRWNRKTCWWFKDVEVPQEETPDEDVTSTTQIILRRVDAMLRNGSGPLSSADIYRRLRLTSPHLRVPTPVLQTILRQSGRFVETSEGWKLSRQSEAGPDQGDDQDPRDGQMKGRWS